MKKVLDIKHHFDDYECMWNGIEDIYITKTGEKIPNGFFFALSGFTSFEYYKNDNEVYKRNPCFIHSNTEQLYNFMYDIVGFTYEFYDAHIFTDTLKKAKYEIDNGYPVVIGALDMYELEYYPKIYHKRHIPIHYVLMVGYDDDKKCIYVYDCGKEDIQSISYNSLKLAMDIKSTLLSKNNSIILIRMDKPCDMYDIAVNALKKRANMFFNQDNSEYGLNAYNNFADDFEYWEKEIGQNEYKKCLLNMIISTATVPTIPNILLNINKPDKILHMGARERINDVFSEIGHKYNNSLILEAGEKFLEAGKQIQILSDKATAYLAGQSNHIDGAKEIILKVSEYEKQAYSCMLKL